ncbi:MAG: hypothetical protein ACRELF_00220, partial [Gemmataceae bacterium]
MSAVAMILTAAMVVPGSGPEMVSGEMEQGLDLGGEWKGIWGGAQGGYVNVRFNEGIIELTEDNGEGLGARVSFIDEG